MTNLAVSNASNASNLSDLCPSLFKQGKTRRGLLVNGMTTCHFGKGSSQKAKEVTRSVTDSFKPAHLRYLQACLNWEWDQRRVVSEICQMNILCCHFFSHYIWSIQHPMCSEIGTDKRDFGRSSVHNVYYTLHLGLARVLVVLWIVHSLDT